MIAQGRLCNVFLRRTAQPCKIFCHECPRAYFLHKKHETFLNISSQCTARPALQNIFSRASACVSFTQETQDFFNISSQCTARPALQKVLPRAPARLSLEQGTRGLFKTFLRYARTQGAFKTSLLNAMPRNACNQILFAFSCAVKLCARKIEFLPVPPASHSDAGGFSNLHPFFRRQ